MNHDNFAMFVFGFASGISSLILALVATEYIKQEFHNRVEREINFRLDLMKKLDEKEPTR